MSSANMDSRESETVEQELKSSGFATAIIEAAVLRNPIFSQANRDAIKVDVYRERFLDAGGVPRAGESWAEATWIDPADGKTHSERMVFAHGYGMGVIDPVTGRDDNQLGLNEAQYKAGIRALLENPIRNKDVETGMPTDTPVSPDWDENSLDDKYRAILRI